MIKSYDYIIIGAGIIGLSLAERLRVSQPDAKILILEKEDDVARHSSGRNSGILHAGFYYSADSFKARFTVKGNIAMRDFCRKNSIPINECGKLVVAQNEAELAMLSELLNRGQKNGSNVALIDESKARDIEPNVRTFKKALFSPDTASVDPEEVCQALKRVLIEKKVEILFGAKYLSHQRNALQTTKGDFQAKRIVNCAGLYADKIAQDFGFGKRYTIIPFKGLYLKYTKNSTDIKINIYPVPDFRNPFLGVHFTKTVDNHIKIGPTAIPAFWRENYQGFENFHLNEAVSILSQEFQLFVSNAFNFRDLAFEEMHKYQRRYFISLAKRLVQDIDEKGFSEFTRPGIRAQLLDKTTRALLQDFVLEGDSQSLHVLNAVSPAFTCAFPFAEFIITKYLTPNQSK